MLKNDEKGQSVVIGALLVIVILFAAFSIWYSKAMPAWKKDQEANFSQEVRQDFAELKSNANLLALKETPNFSLSTTIKASGKDIPLLSDSTRQGSLLINPTDGYLKVTRYWNGGDLTYQPSGSFDVKATDSYFTKDGTLNGNPDWYPVKLVEDLTKFDAEFREETEFRPFNMIEEEVYPPDSENEDEDIYLVKNVDNLNLFTVKFWKLKYLKIRIQNGPSWWGKFWRRDNDLEIKVKSAGGSKQSRVIEGYFGENNENYRLTINLLKNKYYLKGSVQSASGYDIIYRFTGNVHWKYHIAGDHPPVRVETNFEVKIFDNARNELWQGQFQEDDSNLKIQVKPNGFPYGFKTKTFIIRGYFDKNSENYRETLDLLEPKYELKKSVEDKKPYDVEFLNGDEAYGAYDLEGSTRGGVSGGRSESWTYDSGSVTFNLRNQYFVNQAYTYEAGATILEQENKGFLLSPPQINFTISDSITSVSIHSLNLRGVEYSASGSGVFTIDLSFVNSDLSYEAKTPRSEVLVIEMETNHLQAWRKYFDETLEGIGLEKNVGYVIDVSSPTHLTLAVNGRGEHRDVRLSRLGCTTLEIMAKMS